LTAARQSEAAAKQAAEDIELARQIDALRAEQQPVEAQQPQQPQQPQPVQEQAQQADDYVAKALSDPRILSAVEQTVSQANQRADAVANYYQQAVAQNASAAAYSLIASYPELQGINPEQIPTAIQVLAKSNPERARAMVNH